MNDAPLPLRTTDQMAQFVAHGYLRPDAVVPADINEQAIAGLPELFSSWGQRYTSPCFAPTKSVAHNEYVLDRIIAAAEQRPAEATA